MSASSTLEMVASRSGRAEALRPARVTRHYEDVVNDRAVDVVYVNLVNSMHLEWVLKAIQAGKHVLCEKPLAMGPVEVALIGAAADEFGVVVGEAMWNRWHPRTRALERTLSAMPDDMHISAKFLVERPLDSSYRWKSEHGGGALFDLAGYVLTPTLVAANWQGPDHVSIDQVTRDHVDHSVHFTLRWAEGITASLGVALTGEPPLESFVASCTSGSVACVDWAFTAGPGDDVTLAERRPDGTLHMTPFLATNPYVTMVDEFASVTGGGTGWVMPLSESLTMATVISAVRRAAELP